MENRPGAAPATSRVQKGGTYERALVGAFTSLHELRSMLARDLTRQVRSIRGPVAPRGNRRIEEAREISRLIRELKEQGVTPDEFERYRDLMRPKRRSKASIDPIGPGELGPNGYLVQYTAEGDKVEMMPSDEEHREAWPLLLRRNDQTILDAFEEFWEKAWWNRHQNWVARIESGQEKLVDEQKAIFEQAEQAARRIEDKYGRDKLGWNDFEWGLLSGRMPALSWVMGAEWDESLDM